jgi:segregation and condensation protein A
MQGSPTASLPMAKPRTRRLKISNNAGRGCGFGCNRGRRTERRANGGFCGRSGRGAGDRGGRPGSAGGSVRGRRRAGGKGTGSPRLTLNGFRGPLETLLTPSRGPMTALIDQLTATLQQASRKIPLGQMGDWVVMAAWLVQLRTRLLLPADAPAHQEAATEVDKLRTRLVALEDMQALAAWLGRRPQLGHDVFARGQPEIFSHAVAAGQAIDMVEFLWASLAVFDDEVAADTTEVYPGRPIALSQDAEARERILRLLAETPKGRRLRGFCRSRRKSPTVNPIGRCGGARLGSVRSSPVWNWRSKAMWCWGRGNFEAIHIASA